MSFTQLRPILLGLAICGLLASDASAQLFDGSGCRFFSCRKKCRTCCIEPCPIPYPCDNAGGYCDCIRLADHQLVAALSIAARMHPVFCCSAMNKFERVNLRPIVVDLFNVGATGCFATGNSSFYYEP